MEPKALHELENLREFVLGRVQVPDIVFVLHVGFLHGLPEQDGGDAENNGGDQKHGKGIIRVVHARNHQSPSASMMTTPQTRRLWM